MNNMGMGCPPAHGGNDFLFLFMILMIMCPGMFGQGGNNSLMFMMMIMMFSGGMM